MGEIGDVGCFPRTSGIFLWAGSLWVGPLGLPTSASPTTPQPLQYFPLLILS